jgi:hypothetical protein
MKIYRAISEAEKTDIETHQALRIKPGALEEKQFTLRAGDVHYFGRNLQQVLEGHSGYYVLELEVSLETIAIGTIMTLDGIDGCLTFNMAQTEMLNLTLVFTILGPITS